MDASTTTVSPECQATLVPTRTARATYFLAIAAALARHGVRITEQGSAVTHTVLVDIASAVPDAWLELLELALRREREAEGGGDV